MDRKRWLEKQSDKSRAEYFHAQRRASERYGIAVTPEIYTSLCKDIQSASQNTEYVGKQTNRITVWAVQHECHRLLAVYDKQRHRIVTFLPPDVEVQVRARSPKRRREVDVEWPPQNVVPLTAFGK